MEKRVCLLLSLLNCYWTSNDNRNVVFSPSWATHCIHFIDVDNAGSMFASLLEQISHSGWTNTWRLLQYQVSLPLSLSLSLSPSFSPSSLSLQLPPPPPLNTPYFIWSTTEAISTHSLTAHWPAYISTKSDPAMERNGTLASAAMARASSVFPVPRGPYEGGLSE